MAYHYPNISNIYVLKCTLKKLARIPGSKVLPSWFKHWAICVNGFCFEVKRGEEGEKGEKGTPDRIRGLSLQEWKELNPRWNKKPLKVGVTDKSWEQIAWDALLIWGYFFGGDYKLDQQNCQNFAFLLYQRIQLPKADLMELGFPDTELRSFKRFPAKFTTGINTLLYNPVNVLATGWIGKAFFGLCAVGPVGASVAVFGATITLAHLLNLIENKEKAFLDEMDEVEGHSLENLRRRFQRALRQATGKENLPFRKFARHILKIIGQFLKARSTMMRDRIPMDVLDDYGYTDGYDSDFESGYEDDSDDAFGNEYGEYNLQRKRENDHGFVPVDREQDQSLSNNTYESAPSDHALGSSRIDYYDSYVEPNHNAAPPNNCQGYQQYESNFDSNQYAVSSRHDQGYEHDHTNFEPNQNAIPLTQDYSYQDHETSFKERQGTDNLNPNTGYFHSSATNRDTSPMCDEGIQINAVNEKIISTGTPQVTADYTVQGTSEAESPKEWTPWSEWTWEADHNQWRTICWSLTVQGEYREEWSDSVSPSLNGTSVSPSSNSTSVDKRGKTRGYEERREGGRKPKGGKQHKHKHKHTHRPDH